MSTLVAQLQHQPAGATVCAVYLAMQRDIVKLPPLEARKNVALIRASWDPVSQRCKLCDCFGRDHPGVPPLSKPSSSKIPIQTGSHDGESSRHAGSSMHPALKEPQGPIPRPSPHEITFTTPQTPVTDVFQSLASQGPRALAQVSPLQLPNKRVARKPAPTIPRAITRPDEFCQVISSSDFERHIVVREGKFLGKGGQGRVELAKSLTGEMLAIKFVYVDDGPQIDLCDLLRSEKDIFEKLQRGTTQACHQNIVGYRGMYWIEDEKAVAIVMEYIDGYCLDEIERLMKPKEVAALGVQLLKGVEYMHQCGVIHRDLKPSNIMVTKEGIVKIIDFGLGILATADDFDRTGHAGTVGFIAPEVEKRKPCTTASDMWAVGMMLQMCMDGVHPADRLAIKTPGVSKDPIHYVPTLSKGGLPLSLCGVLHKCQTIDPDFRASASDLLKGEFFQRDYDRQDLVKLFKPRRSFKKVLSKAKAYLRRLL